MFPMIKVIKVTGNMIKKMDKNKIEQKNECIMSSILIKIINIIKLNLNLI